MRRFPGSTFVPSMVEHARGTCVGGIALTIGGGTGRECTLLRLGPSHHHFFATIARQQWRVVWSKVHILTGPFATVRRYMLVACHGLHFVSVAELAPMCSAACRLGPCSLPVVHQ